MTNQPNTPRSDAPTGAAGINAEVGGQRNWNPQPVRSSTIDDWLAIAPDGVVTVFTGKVELGTGVRTALAQIVADELDVALDRVRVVMGDTARTPDEGLTVGSQTVATFWGAARLVAAEARRALLALAAERLGAPPDALRVSAGIVSRRDAPEESDDPARSVTYADLLGGKPFGLPVTGSAPPKAQADNRLIGSASARLDLADKFFGGAAFIHDLRVPEMLHGRVVRPPSPGATLRALDDSALSAIPGARAVRLGDFVGVVAEREEQAIRAARLLRLSWDESSALPPQEALYDALRQASTRDDIEQERGDVAAALAGAARVVGARYHQPYQAHASLGPSCAVARVEADGALTVWCSSPGVFALRGALADLLDLPAERLHAIYLEGSGSYGQSGSDDVAADAALLARAVGRPVRVQWSREDEFAWEPKAAAMVIEARAGLDAEGQIVGWRHDVWTPSHANRPRRALDLIAGQLVASAAAPPKEFLYGGQRNSTTEYAVPNTRVAIHWLARSPLRVSSMRSLGGAANTFANESLMDELALAAESDPVAFRLRHLTDPRARAVVEAAAQQARWGEPIAADAADAAGGVALGRGMAFARYENTEAYVAAVAEVAVERATGAVRVRRVVVAHDCGLIVNPDGVRNQIEGNVIQATSRALKEEVRFDATHITSLDWQSYPILTFSEVPEIEVVLIDRPEEKPVGAGEPATVVMAPAIANAIANATGARLRQIPFTPARVRQALAEVG
ncbi:MAG TPA: molybdopterin cofactor-binding domain-containing protein [Ktedonobacterales bacterium]|nr:molybdopterin cofactor-binding domain-containing protein [Ktedonobacterales bacterium]